MASWKFVPIEAVLVDRSLSELYIQDKFERRSSYELLRALIIAQESVFTKPITRGILQYAGCLKIVLKSSQTCVTAASGTVYFTDTVTRQATPIFSCDFDVRDLFITNHVIDRGSNSAAVLNFGLAHGMLWALWRGVYHDMWHAVKQAAKGTKTMWRKVLKFAAMTILSHGPFQPVTISFAVCIFCVVRSALVYLIRILLSIPETDYYYFWSAHGWLDEVEFNRNGK